MDSSRLAVRSSILLSLCTAFVCALACLGLSGCSFSSGGGAQNNSVTPPPANSSLPEGEEAFGSVDSSAISSDNDGRSSSAADDEGLNAQTSSAGLPNAKEAEAQAIIDSMSTAEKVAQLFIVTPEDLTGYEQVLEAGEATRSSLEQYPVGGLIYLESNLASPDQTKAMLSTTQNYAMEIEGLPLFLCVDEEGGTVSRIGGNPGFGISNVGNMSEIGAAGDVQAAKDLAAHMASYLCDLGFNVDFAPCADVSNTGSETMAFRSFGSDAPTVAQFVASQVEGYLSGGMLCCAKHFPGIGGAWGDSHEGTITTEKTIEEMKQEELLPFQAAISAGVPFIMVGHLSCPNASSEGLPASLSYDIVTGLLREGMDFDGIIITDSLSMGAVAQGLTTGEACVAAFEAGADMLLMNSGLQDGYTQVLSAVENGTISEERLDTSVRRIILAKLTYLAES